MDKKQEVKISKFLSLLLRHNPSVIDLSLDENGWAEVDELIEKSAKKGKKFSLNDLKYIVKNNDKQRYTFNENYTKIRANQGHSVNIDLKLEPVEPPAILFHGTAIRNLDSILENGIKKQNRNHVHLSIDTETATKVGIRHGKLVLLQINSAQMLLDGILFYVSKNKVWLCDYIDPKYISVYSG